ncbi:MAG: transposase [Salinibacter sp.]
MGGEKTGPNPTDLGKQGTKRHLLIDGRGIPLAILLTKANRHDVKGLSTLLEEKHLTRREALGRSPRSGRLTPAPVPGQGLRRGRHRRTARRARIYRSRQTTESV